MVFDKGDNDVYSLRDLDMDREALIYFKKIMCIYCRSDHHCHVIIMLDKRNLLSADKRHMGLTKFNARKALTLPNQLQL